MVRRARLKDVAQEAGVSLTTASVALAGRRDGVRIPEPTRQRVEEAARRLRYTPSALARGLRYQETRIIGLLSNRVVSQPFAVAMLDGAQQVTAEHGYLLLITGIGQESKEAERRAVELLHEHHVSRLIYACLYHQVVDPPEGLPPGTIFLNCEPSRGDYRAIVPDDYQGAADGVTHLLDLGHRRIAYLNHGGHTIAAGVRRRAYEDALREHGIRVRSALYGEAPTSTSADAAAARLLDQPARSRPTAIFCFNDRIAVAVYREARRRGLSIPGDLSLVGYDDQAYIAAEQQPGLTTLALPHLRMGRLAIQTALDSSEEPVTSIDPALPARILRVAADLVVRESTAPPARGRARPPADTVPARRA